MHPMIASIGLSPSIGPGARPTDGTSLKNMKRITYLLLMVVLVQVTGAGSLCAPPAGASHDCCDPATTTPAPVSLPECCLVAVPQEHNFATPQRNSDNLISTILQQEA